jgi:cytochrome c-type biogenesis protein CcmH
MNLFWVAAGLISAAAAIIVLLRASRAAALVEPADATSLLYRRQMAELADLAERGLLGEAERASAEAEAGRRLLGAVETPDQAWTPGMTGKAPLVIGVGAAAVLAFALYLVLGAPGAVDQPFAGRLAHWRSVNPQTLAAPEMAAVLSQMTREHPDPEGFRYLALAEIASGNPPGAVRALRRAVKIAPQRADLWEMLGEALTQQDGDASDDARRAFAEALALDPASQGARFYLGRSEITDGDRPKGLAMWRQLLSELPADDPRRAQLQAAILEAEAAPAAGPAGPAGPAAGLTADQLTAVRGMVAGLAAKLKADPGDAAGWVRLVRAYAVLGDTAARDAALKEARARNASRPDVLDDLKNAAAVEPMK